MGWEGQDKIYFFNYIVHIIYDVAIICKINFNKLFSKIFFRYEARKTSKTGWLLRAISVFCELLRICRAFGARGFGGRIAPSIVLWAGLQG